MKATGVRIKRRQVGRREFDSIQVTICDLHLSADLVDDSQIKAAKHLADEHQCWFMYDEHNAKRVREVLGIRADAPPPKHDETEAQRHKEALESIARCGDMSNDAFIAARSSLRWDDELPTRPQPIETP